jgi:CO/xanthine dehydrogenase Mo-binding subunit
MVLWSGVLYRCQNLRLAHKVVAHDLPTPLDMRAPGAASEVYALESALDELADRLGIDLLELRLRKAVNADIGEIEVVFVEEHDEGAPIGVKGLGEIGIVGVAAAVANAVYHATGKRVRDLPITPDKLL